MNQQSKKLANQFIKETGYTKEDFKNVDFGNDIESEVCDWIDSIKGTLMNYNEYEWKYKNDVYTEVCNILED